MIAVANHSTLVSGTRHRVMPLRFSDSRAVEMARDVGLAIVGNADRAFEMAGADVIHVHFWNTPELYAVLRGGLPLARIILTSHVGGATVPHILTRELVELADLILLTSPHSFDFASPGLLDKAMLAPSPADFGRLGDLRVAPHPRFTIGYVGSVDFAKMHPRFVAMHAALQIPGVRVIVGGEGGASRTIAAQIAASEQPDRFELRGYVEDVGSLLGDLDVFGYPLCPENYATAELVLQEAMYAGLPCVVFEHGGPAHVVDDGTTGFVVGNEAEYVARVEYLHRHPEERRRMGEAAAAHARARLGVANLAPLVDDAYHRVMRQPKRAHPCDPVTGGADALLRSLGTYADVFAASLGDDRAAADLADAIIAQASPALASADAGGILHYRLRYPDDSALRFWAGLVFAGQRRSALAAAEFTAASRLGFDPRRAQMHLEKAVAADHQ